MLMRKIKTIGATRVQKVVQVMSNEFYPLPLASSQLLSIFIDIVVVIISIYKVVISVCLSVCLFGCPSVLIFISYVNVTTL